MDTTEHFLLMYWQGHWYTGIHFVDFLSYSGPLPSPGNTTLKIKSKEKGKLEASLKEKSTYKIPHYQQNMKFIKVRN